MAIHKVGTEQPPEWGTVAWAVESLSSSLDEFLDRVAAGTAAPGGGSTSAVAGAMAAALLEMVANLTLDRERYAEVEAEIRGIRDEARETRVALRDLARQDIEAYSRVMEAYTLPKAGEAARRIREAAVQEALEGAIHVPLRVAERGVRLLELALALVERGNRHAAGDAVAGARLAAAAIDVALENITINLGLLGRSETDPFRQETRKQHDNLRKLQRDLLKKIETVLRKREGSGK